MGYKKKHSYFNHDSDPWRRKIMNMSKRLDAGLLREALLVCWCELVEKSVEANKQGNLFCTEGRLEEIWEEHVKEALMAWYP